MSVTIETVKPPEKGAFTVEVKVDANIQITAEDARQKVGVFAGNQVADLLSGDPPTLVVQETGTFWRVPVILSSRSLGRIGVVGSIDVNVETGALHLDDTTIPEIEANARRFAAGTAI